MVYFLKAVGDPDIRIGTTNNIERRMSQLQEGNARELELIAMIPGGLHEEDRIHRQFEKWRINPNSKTWYKPCTELMEFMAQEKSRD